MKKESRETGVFVSGKEQDIRFDAYLFFWSLQISLSFIFILIKKKICFSFTLAVYDAFQCYPLCR